MLRYTGSVIEVFCLFKQKTAYEIGVRLVGSEMVIRERDIRGGKWEEELAIQTAPSGLKRL